MERARNIRDGKDRGGCKDVTKGVKGSLLGGAPDLGLVFLGEGGEGSDDVGVIGNELPIEVSEA